MSNIGNASAPAAALAPTATAPATAPVVRPSAPALKPATAALKAANKAKAAAKPAAKGKVAPVVKSATGARVRQSRVAGFYVDVMELLRGGAKSVTAMAAKLGIEERDVRLAIDRGRARHLKIDRVSKGVFAFTKGFKVPAKDKL